MKSKNLFDHYKESICKIWFDENGYNTATEIGFELIRCKDCKYSIDYYNDGECYCRNENYNGDIYIVNGWNHYCGYAKRKSQ